MKCHLVVPKRVQKQLEKIENKHRQRVILALTSLEDDPHAGKSLEGDHKGHRSYRVGSYRIIYEIKKKKLIILVINVGHRRDVYK